MVLNDTWESGTHIYGISDGACEISFDGVNITIPDDVKATLEDIQNKIVNGEIEFVDEPNDIDAWSAKYQYNA